MAGVGWVFLRLFLYGWFLWVFACVGGGYVVGWGAARCAVCGAVNGPGAGVCPAQPDTLRFINAIIHKTMDLFICIMKAAYYLLGSVVFARRLFEKR